MAIRHDDIVKAFPERFKTFLYSGENEIVHGEFKEGLVIYEVHGPSARIRCIGVKTKYHGEICIAHYSMLSRNSLCVSAIKEGMTRLMTDTIQKCRIMILDLARDVFNVTEEHVNMCNNREGFTLKVYGFNEPIVTENVDLWDMI